MNPSSGVLQTSVRPYPLYDGATVQNAGVIYTALESIHEEPTLVNSRFFCRKNLDVLQSMLAQVVRQKTGMRIDRQSDDELLIAMRAMYLESQPVNVAVHPDAVVSQLNQKVVDAVVPKVTSNLLQYLAYLRDASTLPDVLPSPLATSIKGEKSLITATQML